MGSHWIFQANPSIYDIDAALQVLDQINWRVPQYTGALSPGDDVVIWRSGSDAGIVGVGRVTGFPAEAVRGSEDRAFYKEPTSEARDTLAPINVAPAPFRPKAEIAALPDWPDHQIITAPMGTVFPMTDEQWASLQPLLPPIPEFQPSSASRLPPTFAWEQRRKDVYPLPGGYTGYLDSLRKVLGHVAETKPHRDALVDWVVSNLGVSDNSARLSMGFLLRTGFLIERSGRIELGDIAANWLAAHDNGALIALLHSRTRFIGEFLTEAAEPKSDTEILEIANRYYEAGWQTKAQIRRRRGWLESAGMLTEDEQGKLATTEAGKSLIERLDLRPRGTSDTTAPGQPQTSDKPAPLVDPTPAPITALIERLHTAANDGTDPDRFEKETTEAFRRLGFAASWLGGSGKTDVLLEAELGRDHSYRVVIDCKSTGRGNVSQQIDWDTIDEHREQHQADHAAIVAPGFGGGRLPSRAERHGAILLTVDDLAELLKQHARIPLGLDTYRLLFTSGTTEDGMAAIGEIALEAERRIELTEAVFDLLEDHGPRMGALSARDFALLLGTQESLPDATETEIAEIIAPLATSLLGALTSGEGNTVRLSGQRATVCAMLRVLAERIDPISEPDAEPA